MKSTPHDDQISQLIALYPRLRRSMAIFMSGSRIDADDVVQDAYIKAFEQIHSFRNDSSLYTWLYQIARNRALDLLRKRSPDFISDEGWFDRLEDKGYEEMKGHEEMDDAFPNAKREIRTSATGTIKSNSEPTHSSKEVDALRLAIQKLPATMREVVVLKVQEGFSYEEMEQITGENIQTLKSRMFRAKKRLYELLTSSNPL